MKGLNQYTEFPIGYTLGDYTNMVEIISVSKRQYLYTMDEVVNKIELIPQKEGSNTTGLACQRLNRQFIGIEKEKAYYDIAVKRLSETLF